MPRTKLLVSALTLALAGTSVAQAQSFSSVIVFGDSLSDAGQYTGLIPNAQSFTTNPDDVWSQIVASELGGNPNPSRAGGTIYAWGGAPTSFSVPGVAVPVGCVPGTLPCRSVAQQIADSGPVDPHALYTYWAGANDIFNYVGYVGASIITSAQAQAYTGASALNAVRQIGGLQAAGAKTIVVFNLPDIGRAPNFNNAAIFGSTQANPANAAAISGLSFVYNQTLDAGLATLGDGIVPINVYGLVNEILADSTHYGFTNTASTACNLALTGGSSLFCTAAALREPGANQSYLFADGVHPTGAAHEMVANVVLATLAAPGEVSMAGEVPLQVYEDHSNVINRQIFGAGVRDNEQANVYGNVQFSQQDFKANANVGATNNDLFTATFGADLRFSERFTFGAALSFGDSNGDLGHSSVDNKEVLFSGYGAVHFGHGYANIIATGGSASLDIDRAIVLGPATRIEKGTTNASHTGVEIGAGLSFGDESFRHGPFVGLSWQKVKVDGYAEESNDATAMYFNDFERKSEVRRFGYRFDGNMDGFRPFGRIAWAKDNANDVVAVQAGSKTMNGHFTLDGYPGAEDWLEADLGLGYDVSDKSVVSLSYRARLSDDTQDLKSFNLGFEMKF